MIPLEVYHNAINTTYQADLNIIDEIQQSTHNRHILKMIGTKQEHLSKLLPSYSKKYY